MERLRNRWSLLVLALLVSVMMSCDVLSPDKPKERKKVMITAVDAKTNTLLDSLIVYINGKVVAENVDSYTVIREPGTTITVKIIRNGYVEKTETITIKTDDEVEIPLAQNHPETVTLTYAMTTADGGSPKEVELTVDEEVLARDTNGSLVLPFSEESVSICGAAEYYETSCDTLALTQDREVDFKLARKHIEITITPEIAGYTSQAQDPDNTSGFITNHTAYVLQIGDSVWINDWPNSGRKVDYNNLPVIVGNNPSSLYMGEGVESAITYPAGPEALDVHLWTQYFPKEGHEYSDNAYLNVARGSIELSGDTDSDVTLDLSHTPACSDGVDNDFYDGIDAADPGCIDPETGAYNPEDDVELTQIAGRTYGIFAEDTNYFVSGKKGEQVSLVIGSYSSGFPSSITIAESIVVEFTAFVEEDQAGEEFALRWYIGPDENSLDDVYTTDIIRDEGLDGWKTIQIYELTKEWFQNGTNHKIDAIHAKGLRGESPTDGNDDVIIYEANRDDYFAIQWIYQPERVPESAGKMAKSTDPNVDVTISDVGPKTDIRK